MNEDIRNNIAWTTIDKLFYDNKNFLVKHHLDSYNDFFENGIRDIVKNKNPIKFFKEIVPRTDPEVFRYNFKIYLGGKNTERIYYGKPVIYDTDAENITREHYMYPNEARLRNMTYGFTIHMDIEIEVEILAEPKTDEQKRGDLIHDKYILYKPDPIILENVFFGKFPLMLQSNMCVLNGMNSEARYNMGECKNDPGGYFIIDGGEKVIVSQEGGADNVLYIKKLKDDKYSYAAEIRSVSEDTSKPIRTLSVRICKSMHGYEGGQIVVMIPNVRVPVPLFIVMRALGVISDKNIIETCLLDLDSHDNLIDLFRPSIHNTGYVFTQTVALKFIASFTKVKNASISYVLEILMNYFLPHIGELNFKHKSLYLGYIVKRLLYVSEGIEKPTDRDSYSFKRILNSGTLIKELFREYYALQYNKIYKVLDEQYHYKGENSVLYENEKFADLIYNNQNKLFANRIVEEGFRKAFKGNWGSAAHTKRVGLVQPLDRLSFFSALCHLRKVNLPIAADGAKIVAPRLLSGTQWGLLCPMHTPSGGHVGLHKHLSISTHITKGVSGYPFINYLKRLDMKLLEECSIKYLSTTTKIFINGAWVGVHENPILLKQSMQFHKRNNLIDIYTSILFDIKRNEFKIRTDSGRPIRPIFYVIDNDLISYERGDVLKKLQKKNISWNEMIYGFSENKRSEIIDFKAIKKIMSLGDGALPYFIKHSSVVEYIDTQEAEGNILANSQLERRDYTQKRVTHEDIHPSLIFGIMANQIIFPENNQFPRNSFSCSQGKQAVSLYHSNYRYRLDKTGLLLNYGQIPLTKSRYYKYSNNNEHPYGENTIVAMMCYSGYNVEDAVILNEGSLKRGLFSTTKYSVFESHETKEGLGDSDKTTKFINIEDNDVLGVKIGYDYSKLDDKGIIKEGSVIDDKTILIGKVSYNPLGTSEYIDESVGTNKGNVGIVDKVYISPGHEGNRIVKVKIRAHRIPAVGDKFCSRAGQKGTVGAILPETDFPTTKDGIRPDILVNPHAMPSRMTIGHLVETITSKNGCIFGGFGDCTAFTQKGPQHKTFGNFLRSQGYHSSGCEILYNGMTGEQIEADIYIGPTYYNRLKHMPKDKINYRARGPREVLTRQTVSGRANDGGLRVGELERDVLLSYGMNAFIKDSMLNRGDRFKMAICNKTGCIAAYNPDKNIFLSPMADGPIKFITNTNGDLNIVNVSKFGREFSIVEVPYCFKLLLQELKTMNIQMRLITEDNVDQLMSLQTGDDTIKLTGKDFKGLQHELTTMKRKIENIKLTKENSQRLLNLNPEPELIFGQANTIPAWDNEGEWDTQGTVSIPSQWGSQMSSMIPTTAAASHVGLHKNYVRSTIFGTGTIVKLKESAHASYPFMTQDAKIVHYTVDSAYTYALDPEPRNKWITVFNDRGFTRIEETFREGELEEVKQEQSGLTIKVPPSTTVEQDGSPVFNPNNPNEDHEKFISNSPKYDPNFPPGSEPTSPDFGPDEINPTGFGPGFQLDGDMSDEDDKPKIKLKILDSDVELKLDTPLLSNVEEEKGEEGDDDNIKKDIII